MYLIGLRHKIQWEEANPRVGWFWVPNTFPKPYLNSEPISLLVRSKRSFLKRTLGGDSIGGNEFNYYVLCLNLNKGLFNTCLHTHSLGSIVPFTSVGDEWQDGRLHSDPSHSMFIPLTHNVCHCLWWVLSTLTVFHQSTKVHLGSLLESWPT